MKLSTNRILPCLFVITLLGAGGCNRSQEVRVYDAPKTPDESSSADSPKPADMPAAAPGSEQVGWVVPQGWTKLPAADGQDMRFATFQVDPANPQVVLTVIPLGADAGAIGPNVNRWEGQLGLPPTPEADLPKLVKRVHLQDHDTASTVDLTGPAKDGQSAPRMLAAIIVRGQRAWFFKLAGPAEVVGPHKSNFDAFIASLRFGGTPGEPTGTAAAPSSAAPSATPALPPGHPAMPAAPTTAALPAGHPPMAGDPTTPATPALPAGHPPMPGGSAPSATAPDNTSKVAAPPGWVQDPPKPMRELSFHIDGQGGRAEVIVSKLGRTSFGGLLGNINRWRGQVGLGPITDEKSAPSQPVKLFGQDAPLYDFTGPRSDKGTLRVLIAMAARGDDMWFVKLQGPADLVEAQKKAFESFIATLQLGGGGE